MIVRYIPEMGTIPWWYGIAWHRFGTLDCVALPMPFHLVASWLRVAYMNIQCFRGDWLTVMQAKSIIAAMTTAKIKQSTS